MHVFRWQFDIISARVSNVALTLSGLNSKNSRCGSRRNSRILSKSENASVNERQSFQVAKQDIILGQLYSKNYDKRVC